MTIRWYLNIGSGSINSAVWKEIDSATTIYFTGPDSTSNSADSITPSTSHSYKWAPELWIASSNFSNGSQCSLHTIPDMPNQCADILKIVFENESSASSPVFTAYDNSSMNSTDKQVFGGTPNLKRSIGTNYTPWLKAVETTNGNTPSQGWITGTIATSNTTTTNALKSTSYAVTCSSSAYLNCSKSFAISCAVPSDAIQGDHTWVFAIEYGTDSDYRNAKLTTQRYLTTYGLDKQKSDAFDEIFGL